QAARRVDEELGLIVIRLRQQPLRHHTCIENVVFHRSRSSRMRSTLSAKRRLSKRLLNSAARRRSSLNDISSALRSRISFTSLCKDRLFSTARAFSFLIVV